MSKIRGHLNYNQSCLKHPYPQTATKWHLFLKAGKSQHTAAKVYSLCSRVGFSASWSQAKAATELFTAGTVVQGELLAERTEVVVLETELGSSSVILTLSHSCNFQASLFLHVFTVSSVQPCRHSHLGFGDALFSSLCVHTYAFVLNS